LVCREARTVAVILYYGSGSPYAWRAWLALEHKGVPYELKTMSFAAGDLKTAEFLALNPRRRVPVLVDDGFVLYESAAIVEYIEERWPAGPPLFAADVLQRAVQRRMVSEADQYLARIIERVAAGDGAAEVRSDLQQELACWESVITGDFFSGALSAVDLTLYPFLALVLRIASRKPGFAEAGLVGPRLSAWFDRMHALALVQKTWPPHWR
jgi:glutathione S-transferase